MSNGQKVKFTVTLWAVVFLGAFAVRFGMGFGLAGGGEEAFSQGLQRGLAFIIGLFLAGVIAMQARSYAQLLPKGNRMRLLGQVPLGLTICTLLVGLLIVLRAMIQIGGAVG